MAFKFEKLEVVACLILMKKRAYIDAELFDKLYQDSEKLSAKLLALKNYLRKNNQTNEPHEDYETE